MCKFIGLWCVALVAAGFAPAWAEPVSVQGSVMAPGGKAAAGAEVYLLRFRSYPEQCLQLGHTTSDGQGHFSLTADTPALAQFERLEILARQPGFALGWGQVDPGDPGPLAIQLHPADPLHGQVLDTAGKPVAGALVRIGAVNAGWNSTAELWTSFGIPDELSHKWAAQTDAQGHFTLSQSRLQDHAVLRIEAPGYEPERVYVGTPEDPVSVTLTRETKIRGRVTITPANAPLQGVTANWNRAGSQGDPEGTAPIGSDGSFVLDHVRPGGVRVWLQSSPSTPLQVAGEKTVQMGEGQVLDGLSVAASAVQGMPVSGKVVDAATSKPIPGVVLYRQVGSNGPGTELDPTDADGRYSFYARPGAFYLRTWSAPSPYLVPEEFFGRQVIVGQSPVTGPAIALTQGVTIRVKVVDEKGRPVHGALVQVEGDIFLRQPRHKTSEQGEMSFLADPVKPLGLDARTETAFSDVTRVDPANQAGPVRLVVVEDRAVGIHGVVTDETGRPLPRARVNVREHMGPTTSFGPPIFTDETGAFAAAGLSPLEGYSLVVNAPSHQPHTTDVWQAVPGANHDFGAIVLPSLSGVMEGKILDSKASPVRGARVWTSGPRQAVVETTSDSAGAFSLKGLPKGPCLVFASKAGCQVAGLLDSAPASHLALTLYREDEVPPSIPAPPAGGVTAADREFARAMLERVRAANGGKDPEQSVRALARLDPARAMAAAASQDTVMEVFAGQAVTHDPTAAIAYLQQIRDPERRAEAMIRLADKVREKQPQAALALVRQALEAARAMPASSHQTILLAWCGARMQALGDPSGLPILKDAGAQASHLPLKNWDGYARGAVAEQLCDTDLPAALALADPIQEEQERARHLGNIACHVAVKDPARAKQILASIPAPRPTPGLYRAHYADYPTERIAYLLVLTQPAQAEAFAAAIQDAEVRADTYLWMADRTAPLNRARAYGYLRKAVDSALQSEFRPAVRIPPGDRCSNGFPGGGAVGRSPRTQHGAACSVTPAPGQARG